MIFARFIKRFTDAWISDWEKDKVSGVIRELRFYSYMSLNSELERVTEKVE